MISTTEALALIATTSRATHALRVGSLLRRLARRVGEDEDTGERVGLLRDLDHDHTHANSSPDPLVIREEWVDIV